MTTIKLRNREIPLVYTVYEMKQLQEEVAPLEQLQYALYGRNPDDETDSSRYASPEHLEAVAKLIRILGNAGLEEAGQDPDLTDKWVMRSIRPIDLSMVMRIASQAMTEGMASEIPEKEKEGRVDVTIEEMEKKKDEVS